jgi:hypothetical protein
MEINKNMELFKKVKNFENTYEIGNNGTVRNIKTGKELNQ